jgi:hypothetical protein
MNCRIVFYMALLIKIDKFVCTLVPLPLVLTLLYLSHTLTLTLIPLVKGE